MTLLVVSILQITSCNRYEQRIRTDTMFRDKAKEVLCTCVVVTMATCSFRLVNKQLLLEKRKNFNFIINII